ncbi:MAG: hypothetical protein R3F49_07760 [Planctomycetota bacterium]
MLIGGARDRIRALEAIERFEHEDVLFGRVQPVSDSTHLRTGSVRQRAEELDFVLSFVQERESNGVEQAADQPRGVRHELEQIHAPSGRLEQRSDEAACPRLFDRILRLLAQRELS